MALANLRDENLARLYESVRDQVEADKAFRHKLVAGPTVRQYAEQLRSEMIRRRLRADPIDWPHSV